MDNVETVQGPDTDVAMEIMILNYVSDDNLGDKLKEDINGHTDDSVGEQIITASYLPNILKYENLNQYTVIDNETNFVSDCHVKIKEANEQNTQISISNHKSNEETIPNTIQPNNVTVKTEDNIVNCTKEIDAEQNASDDGMQCEYLDEEYLLENVETKEINKSVDKNNKLTNVAINSKFIHKCKECSVEFVSKTLLKYHRYKNKHDLPFKCNVCQKSFDELQEIICHEESHSVDKPYQCLDCEEMFKLAEELLDHRTVHTRNNRTYEDDSYSENDLRNRKMFKCKRCSATFFTQYGLDKHLKIHLYKCAKCGLKSPNAKYHRKHLGTHRRHTLYSCHVCKELFTSTVELTRHINIHKSFPFQCMDCFKTFKEAEDLKSHRTIHSSNSYVPILPKPSSKKKL